MNRSFFGLGVYRQNSSSSRTVTLAAAVLVLGNGISFGAQSPVMGHVSGSLVALSTPDVAVAARWYRENLGFQPVKNGEMGKGLRFALLRFDNNILEIIQNPEARPLAQAAPGIKDPFEIHGIFKLGFTIRNFDDVLAELKRRGVKMDFEVTHLNDLGLRSFGIRDVDGNLIQFFGN